MKRAAWLVLSAGILGACGSSSSKPDGAGLDAAASPDSALVDTAPGTGSDTAVADTAITKDGAAGGVDAAPGVDANTGLEAGGAADVAATGDGSTQGTSMAVTAATGGKVSLGGASLSIPAGALAADTTITLAKTAPTAEQAARGDIAGSIYSLGPDGTKFLVPVNLALPIEGAIPAGKDAVVAWVDASTGLWVRAPSTVVGTTVMGQVTHFTSFAVLFVGKGGTCPAAPACGGGTPEGTWVISAACFTEAPPMDINNCGGMGTVSSHTTLAVSGSVTFTGARYTADETVTWTSYLSYSAECIAAINAAKMTYSACSDIQTELNKAPKAGDPTWSCAGMVASGCNCIAVKTMPLPSMGAVTVAGNQITFMSDTATKPATPNDFCIKGNVLTVSGPDGVYTAIKK